MVTKPVQEADAMAADYPSVGGWDGVSQRILQLAHRDLPLTSFLGEAVQLLWDALVYDAIELWVRRKERCLCCEVRRPCRRRSTAGVAPGPRAGGHSRLVETPGESLDEICRWMAAQRASSGGAFVTKAGSCWTPDQRRLPEPWPAGAKDANGKTRLGTKEYRSLALLPLDVAGQTIGLLHIKNRPPHSFCGARVEGFQNIARTLSVALYSYLAHSALQERIKELTCLYSLAQLAERPDATLEEVLQGIVDLLPGAWQYPEVAAARMVLDDHSYRTANFAEFAQHQSADVIVNAQRRGYLEVVYLERRPELDEGPFLQEERTLLDAVVRQVALIVERRQAAADKVHLQDQLRHADRLATIGQLAAGVAHELNEPLGNILAFAQLAEKQPGLPAQSRADLGRIVTASLHAREIIKKLLLFARQMPLQKSPVDLNAVIEEGLSFLESRCAQSGVVVKRRLAKRLPWITADPAQLKQVLVNLLVNAVQAMPAGGTFKIATRATGNQVVWLVEDDGLGMSAAVLQKIFIPFYTTKDVHEGTGLGLPVVHGIVTSHGGTIAVRSAPGQGTRCEIRLPLTGAAADQERPSDETVLET